MVNISIDSEDMDYKLSISDFGLGNLMEVIIYDYAKKKNIIGFRLNEISVHPLAQFILSELERKNKNIYTFPKTTG